MPQYVEVADLEKIVRGLVGRIDTLETQQHKHRVAWTTPTLTSPWSAPSPGWDTLQYAKDVNGIVHLRGLISSNGVPGVVTVATLPAGFRPANSHMFALPFGGSGLALWYVTPTGAIALQNSIVGALANTYYAFHNVTFPGEV